jgi:hypothetical protein
VNPAGCVGSAYGGRVDTFVAMGRDAYAKDSELTWGAQVAIVGALLCGAAVSCYSPESASACDGKRRERDS